MPQTATLPTSGDGGGGISSLPTPVKIGLVGGGLGLAFLLIRKMGSGGGNVDSSTSDNTFGIPNTAIMLGSLQQGLLDLKGQVGSGDAQLGDMVTGGFENMGAQIDAQTAAIQSGLGTLQDSIITNQNSNTSTILGALQQRTDALGKLISDSSAAQIAVQNSFKQSMVQGIDAITAQHNAELAAIGALGTNVSNSQSALMNQLQQMDQQMTGIGGQVAGISSSIATQQGLLNQIQSSVQFATANAQAGMGAKNSTLASAFDGKLVLSNTDQNYYYATGGHIYLMGDYGWMVRHFDMSKVIKTDFSLKNSYDAVFSGVWGGA